MSARRRLLMIVLGIIAAVTTYLELRNEKPEPEPPIVQKPAPKQARALGGRVLDEGGVPVPDASVQLFDHAAIWLDGADGGCALSLLACDERSSARELLRQLDAGTLKFPEAVARTQTDADGRFIFPDVHDDQLVATSNSAAHATDAMTLRPQLERVDIKVARTDELANGALLVINPFTRAISNDELAPKRAWAVVAGASDSTVLTPSTAWRGVMFGTAHPLDVQLSAGAGVPPDSEFTLECEHSQHTARSKNGTLHFDDVLAEYCALSGAAGDYGAFQERFLATGRSAAVTLQPRVRLAVQVNPDVAGTVTVRIPTTGIGAIGQLPLAERHFEAGEVRELSLESRPRVRVTFKAPGYARQSTELALGQGLNEVSFTLAPIRTITGQVPSGSDVVAWSDEAYVDATKGVDGGFSIETDVSGPVKLVATHLSKGTATVVIEGTESVDFQLATTRLAIIHPTTADGGPAPDTVLFSPVHVEENWVPANFDAESSWMALAPENGSVVFADPEPGVHLVRAGGTVQKLVVPDAGTVELTLVVVPTVVLGGRVTRQGQPLAGLEVSVGAQRVVSNSAGQFRVEGLVPGAQRVFVSDENGRSFQFDAGAPDLQLQIELPK